MLEKGKPPTCSRCGYEHWRFHPCLTDAPPVVSSPQPQWERATQEGWSEWGDRLHTYDRMGTNLIRKPPPKAA